MPKVFLGIAIAVMIATAVIGYLAKGNIDKLQTVLKETKATLAQTISTLNKTKAELKDTQEKLAATEATVEEQKALIAKQKGEIETLQGDLQKVTMERDEQAKIVADIKSELDKLKAEFGDIKPEELVAKINQLSTDNTKLQTENAELKQVQITLNNRLKETDDKLASANTEIERYRKNIAKVGLSGKVLAVNPGWNFVVLSVGDKQGAAVGANMLVMRGGEPIAKAKITSVEPATSIADVVPGSVRRGITVQPGDQVIFEGQRQ
jgi:uncharacterized phage infection (PIP) family protein YhgE